MIDDNTKTSLVWEQMYDMSGEYDDNLEDLLDNTKYAFELNERKPVLEGVVEKLNKLGCDVNIDDTDEIICELKKRYKAAGIEGGCPKAVQQNWIRKGTTVNPSVNRENLYNLCLALDMGLDETREFFLKNYMTIPFNYKNRIDAIYFYGISNGMNYEQIKSLLSELQSESDFAVNGYTNNTKCLGDYIGEIDDLETFKSFIRENTFSKDQQYSTAIHTILEMELENAEYANIERYLGHAPTKYVGEEYENRSESNLIRVDNGGKRVNRKALLFTIYGYDNQERYRIVKEEKENAEYEGIKAPTTLFDCSSLPKKFRSCFLNDQQYSLVANKKGSPDLYRNALIIMKFYNFYCARLITDVYGTDKPKDYYLKNNYKPYAKERNKTEIQYDLDDFYYETSAALAECGFEQMYVRNPFDWMILYCANSVDPLNTLRLLLGECIETVADN